MAWWWDVPDDLTNHTCLGPQHPPRSLSDHRIVSQGGDAAGAFSRVQLISQRAVGKGVYEEWARITLAVDLVHAPETVRVKSAGGATVTGRRYRLQVRNWRRFALW